MSKINTDNFRLSTKRLQIEKSNTKVLIAISVAVVFLVFSLVATQALYKKLKYQNSVISLRNQAVDQLKKNISATNELEAQYIAFDTSPESITGNSDPNSKVVLNALPSKYDFPALATSLEALLNTSGVAIESITGTDDQVAAEQTNINPKPLEIPFTITAKGSYASIQSLVKNIERSTRPIKITNISLKGTDSSMQATIKATTYYQPLKNLDLEKKVITPKETKKAVKTKAETKK
ncbi:type 4a pilus biogenesis protein PilO [Candidatus Saccharibacteria bacterium]|nr:type 4a pilus biogenesis protein PilO [Candidatus Saccharibacteria bacterium]